ncbi:MAG: hypothetical protein WBG71_06755 [Leeuwenhoekiella sp.]
MIILITYLFVMIYTCGPFLDDGGDLDYDHAYTVQNSSAETFTLQLFAIEEQGFFSLDTLRSNSKTMICFSPEEINLSGCGIDSAVVRFSNGKGFICSLNPSSSPLCFQTKDFWQGPFSRDDSSP